MSNLVFYMYIVARSGGIYIFSVCEYNYGKLWQ